MKEAIDAYKAALSEAAADREKSKTFDIKELSADHSYPQRFGSRV
jgi:hypothetical protein